ncbi:unnamed protein product [Chondrus crispus]|uniref:Uncharacterized protein n=1 Tax=Chondrus crispus TaxID=2769 RepID=R7QLX9_CHOCR|nr:unnamed protein product [Chondrus crispus]CDF39487.1 unnamed protein product [Chondrus crispus]|eukprot:XP_005719398.1 unnamed protein product [Chondrus crispus]
MPAPVGTPADIAFGGAVVAIGAAALLLFGNGFNAGRDDNDRGDGMGLPGAPNARRARGKDGKPPKWPPRKGGDDQ